MKKRILFIVNPISGLKDKNEFVRQIPSYFPENKYIIRVEFSLFAGHAIALAQQAAQLKYDAVVACGGDGTVNEVGSTLINTDTALGIVPFGSGNGLARHLKIPLKYRKALTILSDFHSTAIDTGLINDKPFIGIAGIGFDAFIGKKFANYGKRGFLSYLKLVVKEYKKYPEREIDIKKNKVTESIKAMMITVANSSQFGNNAIIAPTASLTDGKLNLCILRKFPLWKSPLIAWLMATRRIHKSRYLKIYEIKKVTIRQSKKLAHLDGEPIKLGRKIKIRVVPKSLFVLTKKGVTIK